MGPIVGADWQQLVFRPYKTSRTYANLKRHRQGVLHVTDDVELLAYAAVGQPEPMPELLRAAAVDGWIIASACRWYAFRVSTIEDSADRTEIAADVVERGTLRDFFGLNRAKHAVLEAAILATRTGLLPAEQIMADVERLRPLVQKTGGEPEHRAFQFLERYIAMQLQPQAR
jgi:hypothetical protein